MYSEERKNLSDFYVIGINYRKTDATVRGQFAINNDQYSRILDIAPSFGIDELFILSTCNRTEVYGFAQDPGQLGRLLCTETLGDFDQFDALCYIKKGAAAAEHLFSVSAGLDSQVLGDYEILGQMKVAAKFAKSKGFIKAFTERLINSCLQASKAIKTHTRLSDGTVSVSFAAIQFIREQVTNVRSKRMLLLGLGKIGSNTCKNIVDYLGTHNVVLVNRTYEKAIALAESYGLQHAPIADLEEEIRKADIIITATSATTPFVTPGLLQDSDNKILIDLSIPYNIDPRVAELDQVRLLNVDDLSKMKDETLKMRIAEVPKAKAIIAEQLKEFSDWCQMRQHVPVLIALKQQLARIENCPIMNRVPVISDTSYIAADRIQKVINTTALKLKSKNTRGCYVIEAINEFIAL